MRRIVGTLLTITAALACPCHLPLTMAILVGVLGGTSLGAALLGNTGLLVALLAGYFAVALLAGLRLTAGLPGRTSRTPPYHIREPKRGSRRDEGRCGRAGHLGSPDR